ncbi:hypothetical protein Sjap_018456 [Stephania japonica]|uniref:NAC domain-containing protein n=1 Tax=Stephania japonica TaxID=461633 RepID=A0AAP0NN74_9MAGN
MPKTFLQPGFRFCASDEELVMYYLKRKVMGKSIPVDIIRELDLYKFAPWDLPDMSYLRTGDLEWYFFCPRGKKNANGKKVNRTTEKGHWKTTGKDRPVIYDSRTVGMKKTLIFHLGRAPKGDRTNWVMHEYRLHDMVLADAGVSQDAYVLCKVREKSGLGPKNGERYGAPFREEDWEDDVSSNLEPVRFNDLLAVVPPNNIMENSGFIVGDVPATSSNPIPCHAISDKHPLLAEDGKPSSVGPHEEDLHNHVGNSNKEEPAISSAKSTVESHANDIFNDLEDLSFHGGVKDAERVDFLNIGGKDAPPSQILLGDDSSFMELYDLDHPICFPGNSYASEHLPYMDVGNSSKPKLDGKCGFSNWLTDGSIVEETCLEESRAYMELKDLISAPTELVQCNNSSAVPNSELNLKTVDESPTFASSAHDFTRDQVPESDIPYVELNDLLSPLLPMEIECISSSNQIFNETYYNHPQFADDVEMGANQSFPWDLVPPFNAGGHGNEGNFTSGFESFIPNPGFFLPQETREEALNAEDLVREGDTVTSCYCDGSCRGEQQIAHSRAHRLLDSIPARPASAAEHPCTSGVGKGSKGRSSLFGCYGGPSIHVKAEVTVRCSCTNEALPGKLGTLSCHCYHRRYVTRKSRNEGSRRCGGFSFMFILAMVTALFWLCIFAVAVKLAQCSLKLILS